MTDANSPRRDQRESDQIIEHLLGDREATENQDLSDSLAYELELAAAQLDMAVASSHPLDTPLGLADRIKAHVSSYADQDGLPTLASDHSDNTRSPNSPVQDEPAVIAKLSWVPWMVAAACILITTVVVLLPRNASPVLDLNAQRLALLENSATDDLVQWDWISTGDPSVTGEVFGDVVWSNTLNKGYMRISGLEINDPKLTQYQLWIFDSTRPSGALPQFGEGLLSQRPIDGGVFDINADGEVIVEINAKLTVKQAAAFAITIEPPGGVVVSDRSRVPLLALAK